MIVTSDFECGNGKQIRRVADRHYIITERGDKVTYCYYFCFRIAAETPEEAGDVLVEVVGDPDLEHDEVKDVGTVGLIGHTPCNIWYTRWGHWKALPAPRVEFTRTSIRATVPVHHDDPVTVTNVVPATLTDTTDFLKCLAEKCPEHSEYVEVGESCEGRSFPGIRITDGLNANGKIRAVCFSGQHPIEFPGVWGTRGIAEYLTGLLPEAAEYRRRFDVWVLPLVNPDGTVMGNNNFNAKGEEVMSAGAASEGELPDITEARSLWEFLDPAPPELMLNIHCYCGWGSFVEPPYNGVYFLKDEYFGDQSRLKRQKMIEEFARFKTTGLSGHTRPSITGENSFHAQMAMKHGTCGFLYEINAGNQGPWGCSHEGIAAFRAMADGYLAGR